MEKQIRELNKSKLLKGDTAIWSITIILSFISILTVYSATRSLSYRFMGGNTEYYLIKHSILILVSFALMWIVHNIDYKYFASIAKIGMVVSIPLLVLTWRYGVKLNDASRWINIPIIGKSFQPSDMAQLSLILYLASHYAKNQKCIEDVKKSFFPIVKWGIPICGLIGLTNASGAIILLTTCLVIMFIARINVKYLFMIGSSVFIIGCAFIFVGQRRSTFFSRIDNFITGKTPFQTEQAYIAIVSGGLQGKGPGNSVQKNILPHPYSDFIYAILIEEYGLIGGLIVMLLYFLLLYRSIKVITYSNNIYKSLLAIGLGFSITFQAFVNMAVSIGLVPVTGLTLPFVSMGGTSLMFTGISLGILVSCTKKD